MRRYTSLTDRRKEPQIPAGLTAVMLISLAVGIFAAGCLTGLRMAQIKPERQPVNFHKIHEAEHFNQ
jgi:hypothetical protein